MLQQRKKAEEEEERWRERQMQREKRLQGLVLKRAQANDPHLALSQTHPNKLKEFRYAENSATFTLSFAEQVFARNVWLQVPMAMQYIQVEFYICLKVRKCTFFLFPCSLMRKMIHCTLMFIGNRIFSAGRNTSRRSKKCRRE